MENNLIFKIKEFISKKEKIDEDNVRSFMILVRKVLDNNILINQDNYLTLRLFCNWAVHNEITNSNIGLRILSKINDTLVDIKDTTNITEIQSKLSNTIGFAILRNELKLFLLSIDSNCTLVSDNNIWIVFLKNLIEIIRDVPLSFPSLSNLDKNKQKIYNKIIKNPIKPGAGVISVKISMFKYPNKSDEDMSLFIKTEDTTTVISPLLIDIRL